MIHCSMMVRKKYDKMILLSLQTMTFSLIYTPQSYKVSSILSYIVAICLLHVVSIDRPIRCYFVPEVAELVPKMLDDSRRNVEIETRPSSSSSSSSTTTTAIIRRPRCTVPLRRRRLLRLLCTPSRPLHAVHDAIMVVDAAGSTVRVAVAHYVAPVV